MAKPTWRPRNSLAYASYPLPTRYPVGWKRGANFTASISPYRPMAGRAAKMVWNFLSGTPADYDGRSITLVKLSTVPGFGVGVTIEFDDDGGSGGSPYKVNIQGLATATAICEATAAALRANGFRAVTNGAQMVLFQPVSGWAGNLAIAAITSTLAGELEINGLTVFDGVTQPKFYGGADFSAPAMVNGRGCMLATGKTAKTS